MHNQERKLNLDILWWGRSDTNYSRNRVIRTCLERLGCRFSEFNPANSLLGILEAYVRRPKKPSLIWVPCFRQRDMYSAFIWAKKHKVPLVFDPLISAYDKQVYERKKFAPEDSKAITLLNWEKNVFQKATMVIGDTREHCNYFHTTFGVEQSRLIDIAVGAEEKFFKPATHPSDMRNTITVLFYGSFLGLQGPLTIIEAAKKYNGLEVQWKLIGEGPLLGKCKAEAAGLDSVEFIPWVPYEDLPSHIQKADIVLGIFGTSEKANRVIPNKVYQTLACGKPLVTMRSPAYPKGFTTNHDLGIHWVTAGDAHDLATTVAELAGKKEQLQDQGDKAYSTFIKHFSEAGIEQRLLTALKQFCS